MIAKDPTQKRLQAQLLKARKFYSACLTCFIFNAAFAPRAREQFRERMPLLEILHPSPLLRVQKLTINVTEPSYPFPIVVFQQGKLSKSYM